MKKYYYCDIDGVLANLYAVEDWENRFKIEKGFFTKLPAINENVFAIRELIRSGESVKILSASPNKQADKDKREWLKKFIPELKNHNIIIVPLGTDKKSAMKTKNGILFDDYGKNCIEWEEKSGNIAIKIKKDFNISKAIKEI